MPVPRPAEHLAQLTDQKLAAAVELNSAEWLRLQGCLPWVEFHEDGDALWVFAGDTWPRNSVALARFTHASAPTRIGEILSHHLAHKVACHWIVGPLMQPSGLSRHLRARLQVYDPLRWDGLRPEWLAANASRARGRPH